MAVYPDNPLPQFPLSIEPEWRTIPSLMDGGKEQRKAKRQFAVFNAKLQYAVMKKAEFDTIWAFYQSCKGAYASFYFFDNDTHDYAGLYINAGDGVATIFDLPGKSTSSHTIYLDGNLQSSGYTILTGGGQGSADRISFTTHPSNGVIISCGFTGILRIKCRFQDDKMSRELFTVALYRTGINLKGLSGA
jgi:hypothetical protein